MSLIALPFSFKLVAPVAIPRILKPVFITLLKYLAYIAQVYITFLID